MVNTSIARSHQKWICPISESSSMMQLSEMRSEVDNKCYLPTETNSPLSTQPLSCLMELNPLWENQKISIPMETDPNPIFVDGLTPQMDAQMDPIVNTNTFVTTANDLATTKSIVTAKMERAQGLQPKYLQYNLWSPNSKTCSTTDWTEITQLLPSTPFENLITQLHLKL